MSGLREETVHSPEDVLVCLDSGAALRHTASTQMNEYSSRSHCIFTIMIGEHFHLIFIPFFNSCDCFKSNSLMR